MYYVIIDCGTTNSRAYVVDSGGKVYGVAKKTVGVKDTSITGSRDTLRSGLKEIVAKAIGNAGILKDDVAAVLSSGMITSEIGLCEIPHADAPCGEEMLASSITRVEDAGIVEKIPVYFVRGIKNPIPNNGKDPTAIVGRLDFMRGEETQVVGMMADPGFRLPAMVVVLSSHTKFIPVDENGMIRGSLSTMSGQLFDSVVNHTFLHKSVVPPTDAEKVNDDYYNEAVICDAIKWLNEVGLARSLMFPRFLDVLLDTEWQERRLFLDALVAAEDMLSVKQLGMLTDQAINNYYLVGNKARCKLYEYIIGTLMEGVTVTSVCDMEAVDRLSIVGMLKIAKKAGIVK